MCWAWLVFIAAAAGGSAAGGSYVAPHAAPSPSLGIPAPSAPQLTALQHTFSVFHHYSLCTYVDCQWDLQTAPPTDFAPPDAGPNFDQWMTVTKSIGATQACLTVRHVDGFALWPTRTSNYSVAASGWRGGKGDIAADFVAAARRAGISPCFYVILGFNVQANHSNIPPARYLDDQVTALTELLTNYGQIDRLWFDNYAIGCCQPVTVDPLLYCPGGGTESQPSAACPGWQLLIDTVRALSPGTAMIPGPDGCLVNGESFGGTYPLYHAAQHAQASYSCTDASAPSAGQTFSLTESDFTVLEPGDNWFWAKDDPWLNGTAIYAQYAAKLEQGASLILNIPPNSSGVIPQPIVDELAVFARLRAAAWAAPAGVLAAPVSAPCAALSIELPISGDFDTILLAEDLSAGQVVAGYTVEARDAATRAWRPLLAGVHGRTVGSRLVDAVGLQRGVDALRWNCSADLAPLPPPPPASFVNAAGACMGLPDGQTWPCYVGRATPGGPLFHLCPLVAASCGGAAALWTPGGAPGTLFALGAGADATVNIDCDSCAAGTHAKIIADGDCGCAAPLAYDAAAGQLAVAACPGMCLTNGTAPGAAASCAGQEPFSPTQLHLAPCADESTRGWRRVDAAAGGARTAAAAAAAAVNATIATFGAYLSPAGAAGGH